MANRFNWIYYGNKSQNKYGNQKITIDGETFDSKREALRWQELKLAESADAIRDLKRQVRFEVIPAQREPDERGAKGGIKKGKTIERKVEYVADFTYIDTQTGELVVEDTKGMRTPEYIIKRKLMLQVHGIRIREV